MTKPYPALCADCKHSKPDPSSAWKLLCMHPKVNARDPWALADAEPHGSDARSERERRSWFAPCGMRGRQWEARADKRATGGA